MCFCVCGWDIRVCDHPVAGSDLGSFSICCVRARVWGRRLCGIKPVRCTAIRTPRGLIPSGTWIGPGGKLCGLEVKAGIFTLVLKLTPLPLLLSPLSLSHVRSAPKWVHSWHCYSGYAKPTCPGSWSTNLGDNHWKRGCRSYPALCAVSSLV